MTPVPPASEPPSPSSEPAPSPSSAPHGVFGASFDPPHLGHVMACVYARAIGGLGTIHVVPTGRHAFDKRLTPGHHRLAMARLAFADLPWCLIETLELDAAAADPPRTSYTIDTVAELHRRHPGVDFRLVVGTDLAASFDQWYRIDELREMAPPFWVPRSGERVAELDAGLPDAFPGWSSSQIRRDLAAGTDVRGCVPLAVLRYIEQHSLYRGEV